MSFVYLETGMASNNFNLRGEVTDNDDPISFARFMERKGLRVAVVDSNFGKNVSYTVLGLEELVPIHEDKTNITPKFKKANKILKEDN